MTAVRLGTSRYFRCPECHQRALFDLTTPGPNSVFPNYSDSLGWGFVALLSFAVAGPILLALAPRLVPSPKAIPEFSLAIVAVLLVGLISIATFTLIRSRLQAGPLA